MSSHTHPIQRVIRTKAQAKESYDRMSRFYDAFAGASEHKYSSMALKRLAIASGETVLEIGFGTGHCLQQMAEAVGENGKVYGIDISSGMLAVSQRRLERAGLGDRIVLSCGDAMEMPYANEAFDSVLMSFALELFDSPEIPQLLAEIRRVLKPGGQLGVVSMSQGNGASLLLRLYEWLHERLPQYVDCRPIYAEELIREAGFTIMYKEQVSIMGLPVDIVIALKSIEMEAETWQSTSSSNNPTLALWMIWP